MKNKRKKKSGKTTLEDVRTLIEKAEAIFKTDKSQANDYVRKARRAAMKTRTRLPPEIKRRICKHCHAYLKPGINARIRIHDGKIILYCFECKKFKRMPLKKRREEKKGTKQKNADNQPRT